MMLLGGFICLEGVGVQPNGVALFSLATVETYFSYQRAIWNAAKLIFLLIVSLF